jgi:hypothetical protein
MTMIDEDTLAKAQAELVEERRRAGRMAFDNPHLVHLLRRPDAEVPSAFDDMLLPRATALASKSRLLETILASLGFWALAFWLLKTCVG